MTSAPVPSSLSPALGLVAGTAAVALAWLGGSGTVVPVGLVTASLAAAGVATVVPLAGAMTSALLCWAIYDGFAVHRFGELQLSAADLRALAIVATAACLTQVVAGGIREIRADLRPRHFSHCRIPGLYEAAWRAVTTSPAAERSAEAWRLPHGCIHVSGANEVPRRTSGKRRICLESARRSAYRGRRISPD